MTFQFFIVLQIENLVKRVGGIMFDFNGVGIKSSKDLQKALKIEMAPESFANQMIWMIDRWGLESCLRMLGYALFGENKDSIDPFPPLYHFTHKFIEDGNDEYRVVPITEPQEKESEVKMNPFPTCKTCKWLIISKSQIQAEMCGYMISEYGAVMSRTTKASSVVLNIYEPDQFFCSEHQTEDGVRFFKPLQPPESA